MQESSESSRLDRIEAILEKVVVTQMAHGEEVNVMRERLDRVESGHETLQTTLLKLGDIVVILAESQLRLEAAEQRTHEELQKLAESQRHTDQVVSELSGKVDALVAIMDDLIRKRPPQ